MVTVFIFYLCTHNNIYFLNLPCILLWALMGDRMGRHLEVAWKLGLFNSLMALSLLMTTLWMLMEALA